MLCFVALIVFAILGIFSAKYRALAIEAFGCVGRTMTLRPCESKLDERIKATLVAKTLEHSPPLAKALHKHFALFSLLFTLLFFGSMIYSVAAVYNYWAYGNCNGPNSSAFCVFDAVAGNANNGNITFVAPGVGPLKGNGSIVLVEFGCFSCPYTKSTEPLLSQFLAKHPEVSLEFRAYPIVAHNTSTISAEAAFCADEQGKFWQYHDELFTKDDHSLSGLRNISQRLGMDLNKFDACMNSSEVMQRLKKDEDAGKAAGIYGTPTFFLNKKSLVGPKTLEDFENLLAGNVQHSPEQMSSCKVQ
ncbi:MAG: thioredoxin domain-containing protein [Candidatus Micrarchaeia archaeon]